MIGSLRGTLVRKAPPQLMLEVGGVGYELDAPLSTFYVLPGIGTEVQLLTHLVVREDAQVLFGFASEAERTLFRNLLKVSGIGPRIALGILSGVSVDAFRQCVRANDAAALTRIPGVGRKTAERLLVEMRDRLGAAGEDGARGAAAAVHGGPQGEAFNALVALGYKPAEATRLLSAVPAAGLSTEELIRRALQGALRA
ncbi:MAG: Holliday junction branch migration protein RuvA [Steroidobacteraceae bacterium]|nr:Holliday junction branch migration protein RuvA [Steroidobacteraceae bacterium]MDW8257890.1 Holliday junction branch migration protein RuvA [Gammaproteobacteria bacterium]